MQAAADRAGMSSSLQAAEQAAAEAVARADALDHQLEQVKASAERQHKVSLCSALHIKRNQNHQELCMLAVIAHMPLACIWRMSD